VYVAGNPQYQQLRPAVVVCLLHNGKVTEEAFSQTLLALAGDGWLAIEPQDSGVPLVRIMRAPGPNDVKSYEHLAFERVVRRMGALTHVPISVLTSSEGEDYDTWWKRFTREVKAEAESSGLVKGIGALCCLYLLGWLGGAPLLAWAYLALGGHGDAVTASFFALIPSFAVVVVLAKIFRRSELTELGREAAAWWRHNGGGLSGALLTDRLPPGETPSPHSPESLMQKGLEPLPSGHVWSSFGGTWRMVKVGPTKSSGWGKPSTLTGLIIFAAFATVPAALTGHFVVGGGRGTLIGLAPAAFFGALALFAWLPSYRRHLPIPTQGTFTGQVVKRWTYESGGEDSTTYYCCCIDDGTSPEGWSFEIDHKLYTQMRVGDTVYVDFNPRWHTVNQIQLTTPAPGPR
jgi:hypothetical protein